jgi:hypothetical protein
MSIGVTDIMSYDFDKLEVSGGGLSCNFFIIYPTTGFKLFHDQGKNDALRSWLVNNALALNKKTRDFVPTPCSNVIETEKGWGYAVEIIQVCEKRYGCYGNEDELCHVCKSVRKARDNGVAEEIRELLTKTAIETLIKEKPYGEAFNSQMSIEGFVERIFSDSHTLNFGLKKGHLAYLDFSIRWDEYDY